MSLAATSETQQEEEEIVHQNPHYDHEEEDDIDGSKTPTFHLAEIFDVQFVEEDDSDGNKLVLTETYLDSAKAVGKFLGEKRINFFETLNCCSESDVMGKASQKFQFLN